MSSNNSGEPEYLEVRPCLPSEFDQDNVSLCVSDASLTFQDCYLNNLFAREKNMKLPSPISASDVFKSPVFDEFDESVTFQSLEGQVARKLKRARVRDHISGGTDDEELLAKRTKVHSKTDQQFDNSITQIDNSNEIEIFQFLRTPAFRSGEYAEKKSRWIEQLQESRSISCYDNNTMNSNLIWYRMKDSVELFDESALSHSDYNQLVRQHALSTPFIRPVSKDILLDKQRIVIQIPKNILPPETLHNMKTLQLPRLKEGTFSFSESELGFCYAVDNSTFDIASSHSFDEIPLNLKEVRLEHFLPKYGFSEICSSIDNSITSNLESSKVLSSPVVFQGRMTFLPFSEAKYNPSYMDDGFDDPPPDFISSFRNFSSKSVSVSVSVPNSEENKKAPAQTSVEDLTFSTIARSSLSVKQVSKRCRRVWLHIMRKEFPKEFKKHQTKLTTFLSSSRRVGHIVSREVKKNALRNAKSMKDYSTKSRKVARDIQTYWRKAEKDILERQRNKERQLIDQQKKEEEKREDERQKRKLEFLLTQTELFSHFIGRKMGISSEIAPTSSEDMDMRAEAEEAALGFIKQHREESLAVVQTYKRLAGEKSESPSTSDSEGDDNVDLLNPSTMPEQSLVPEPSLFNGKLKSYQLKGLNWLVNLYDQGINGILADEMGLGKTIQSISLLSYLADTHNIWGPFLIIAPNSTLLQWVEEINRFCPSFNVIPYWGDIKSRKTLRKFWNPKDLYQKDASFHCCVTSYATFVGDEKYFSKLHWQYVILDEAQQIKNAASMRWKSLLNIKCRNRLLLTGTPIQNSMAELWALLHFIMPSIFDSHAEFNEWFSKDIESHASGNQVKLDAHQVQRLHVILKPFMLRRVKSDVENEMAPKIEIQVNCELSRRQKEMYLSLKDKVSASDLPFSDSEDTESLMNLVMQFRKVCNHPEIFERRFASSPFVFCSFDPSRTSKIEKMRRSDFTGHFISACLRNPISFQCPVLLNESVSDPLDLLRNRRNMLDNILSIWHPSDIHSDSEDPQSQRSFLGLLGSASELSLSFWSSSLCGISKFGLSKKPPHISLVSGGHRFSLEMKELRTSRYSKSCTEHMSDLSEILRFGTTYVPKAIAPPIDFKVDNRQITLKYSSRLDSGWVRQQMFGTSSCSWSTSSSCLSNADLPLGVNNLFASSCYPLTPPASSLSLEQKMSNNSGMVRVPHFRRLLADSGKLVALHELLKKLKAGGHRVLIFSQMVRMIDILEDYMHYCGHKMFRLDGQTDVFTRRQMVNEFQENDDIFAFLLSTRAGGLGITLTAADTVIFYDIDWNPTMDSQAMDRVHRIGQTKQVVVYRLVCKNTIEEKILQRAQEKHNIQKTVYSGGFQLQKSRDQDNLKKNELKEMLLS